MKDEQLQEAEVLDFPKPGTRAHTNLKLKVYAKDNIPAWDESGREVFESACMLFDMGLIDISWLNGEPMFKITETGSQIGKQMGLGPDIPVQEAE